MAKMLLFYLNWILFVESPPGLTDSFFGYAYFVAFNFHERFSQLKWCVAEWLMRSALNLVRSTRVGSNPVVGTTNHKPTVNSAVYPSEVGK